MKIKEMENYIFVFSVLFLCILLFLIFYHIYRYFCFHKKKVSMEIETFDQTNKEIPRIIWSFWNDENLPFIVEKCVRSWEIHNPGIEIRLLNNKTWENYVKLSLKKQDKNLSLTHFSDYLRFALLEKYGGIWMDATNILYDSLDWVFEKSGSYEFIGYYIPNFTTKKEYPVIENWFLACPPNSTFIKKWNTEIKRVLHFDTAQDYLRDLVQKKVDLQNIPISIREYLICHVALQKIIQIDYSKFHIYVIPSTEKKGPSYYSNENGWDVEKSLKRLCEDDKYKTDMVKLRGDERKYLENDPELVNCIFTWS